MSKKLLSTPPLLFFLLLFSSFMAFGQETIRFKTLRATEQDEVYLKEQFKAYTLATLGTEEITQLLQSKDYFNQLALEYDDQTFSFNLRARDIRAPHYKLRALTPAGVIEYPRTPNKTFYGFTHNGQYDVRITADEDFFYGMILQADDALYIEPAKTFIPGAPKNQFVI